MPVLASPALTFRDADKPGDASSSSSGQRGGIFAVEGVPLRIHIPRNMEAAQRSRLASLVKRNGGRVEQGLDGCRVAIFDLEQPVKARQTLHAAQAYTPPIQVVAPAWIEECVEAKKLLDVADGAYNPIAIMERKRIRLEKIEAKREAEMALEQRNGSIAHNERSSSHAVNIGTGQSVHKKRPIVGLLLALPMKKTRLCSRLNRRSHLQREQEPRKRQKRQMSDLRWSSKLMRNSLHCKRNLMPLNNRDRVAPNLLPPPPLPDSPNRRKNTWWNG
ncbi:hypothetical protein IE81DRAFT_62669 [Ceraceosorus guamensis]|uniref:BRCT domain-containing protein n=1 Tax=Ceraceosorus guamensis TaxID=1522189 RepID=A0A316VN31_9BASI|nr:hypothetical protein IE81DRAFT_62669 [Ceraceosorus guamensis]PWN38967.1 hypothetical protein IE81DRAFT_62669 [Ceraceosorus guamensis]